MITTQHPVSGEDLMAFLDGELPEAQAPAISTHVEHCAECKLMVAGLESTSASLHRWSVPDVPAALEEAVPSRAGLADSRGRLPRLPTGAWFRNRRVWALGGVGAAAMVLLIHFVAFPTLTNRKTVPIAEQQAENLAVADDALALKASPEVPASEGRVQGFYTDAAPAPPPLPSAIAGKAKSRANASGARAFEFAASARAHAPAPQAVVQAPMIARTVALTIQVKDLPVSRASLDSILMRYHGYAAQLTINTAENTARAFQGSLRIPADKLASAIADLRGLGKVETESQSGEEVTQQHADLAARLQNSRETEQRLRTLLAERTGRIDDVLQVEEEMARVRGEIEQMTADQQALEHRVDFATIDLQLTEQYTATLESPSPSVGNRMHNAMVAGVGHAGALLLGIVLWFEEFGPALLIIGVILVLPAMLLLRRYRRMHGQI
jgi:hypothetical protein